MVHASSAPGQPIPGETPSQPVTCPPDCDLPENSQENLDARLDHAIEETFPSSDPISVIVTKKAVAPDQQEVIATASRGQGRAGQDQAEQATAEKLLDQVNEALQDMAQTASGTAREAYRLGQRYVRHARDSYPEAERSYRASRRTLHQWMTDNPWSSLFVAGAIGYGLAWMIHGKQRGPGRRVPDYARTRRDYASQGDTHHRW
ncbi:hypothetical protein JO965_19115 [Microvirga sp. VF16]|nr:hypothetical protein [Microvirga sp. VF16]QRM32148.1 hypothetical protein JO965_19115 [Microvirga sp. VF16]